MQATERAKSKLCFKHLKHGNLDLLSYLTWDSFSYKTLSFKNGQTKQSVSKKLLSIYASREKNPPNLKSIFLPQWHMYVFSMTVSQLIGFGPIKTWFCESNFFCRYTYEVAPVFTLMEKEVYNKMLNLIGFNGGEAIFVPGE